MGGSHTPTETDGAQGSGPTCGHRGLPTAFPRLQRRHWPGIRATTLGPIFLPAAAPRTLALLPWGGLSHPSLSIPAWGFLLDSVQVVPVWPGLTGWWTVLRCPPPRPGFRSTRGGLHLPVCPFLPVRASVSSWSTGPPLHFQAMTESYDVMIDGRWVQREP